MKSTLLVVGNDLNVKEAGSLPFGSVVLKLYRCVLRIRGSLRPDPAFDWWLARKVLRGTL